MIQEIKYGGHTANPSDYECAEGSLATALNIVPEDGILRPIFPPSIVLTLEDGYVVKYIHETAIYKHYIIFSPDNHIYYVDDENENRDTLVDTGFSVTDPISVTGIGNTLVILTNGGMEYYLWKDEAYSYLGNHLPEIELSFGLQGYGIRTDEFTVAQIKEDLDEPDYDDGDYVTDTSDVSDINERFDMTEATSTILAKVNKFIADNSVNEGRFIFPFFVRYAYRLYDGTLTMQSAPILMMGADKCVPLLYHELLKLCYKKKSGSDNNYYYVPKFKARLFGVFYDLDYCLLSDLDELKKWSDIISSVDIFISAPLYTYDQNEEVSLLPHFWYEALGEHVDYAHCVCKHVNRKASITEDTVPSQYQYYNYNSLYFNTFDFTYNISTGDYNDLVFNTVKIPSKSDEDIADSIRDCANFYLLESFDIEELATERTIIDIDDEYLQSLQTRETLTDDYDSHDTLIPKRSFNYNSRFNITNLYKSLFNGFTPATIFEHSDGYVSGGGRYKFSTENNKTCTGISIYVTIERENKTIVVKSSNMVKHSAWKGTAYNFPLTWFYYPDTNAKKVTFDIQWSELVSDNVYANKHQIYTAELTTHDFLNGAYWFGNWDDLHVMVTESNTDTVPSVSSDKTVYLNNKIYTSDVNNPFFFPLSGINTVGTGTILGISTASRALSQGQFGQFPLYAFTTDGVWALEVSSTGSYSAKQPITRDVCTNPDSITQIDSSVLFVTDRGIIHISGSNTECISDTIMSANPAGIENLINMSNVLTLFNQDAELYGTAQINSLSEINVIPVKDFLKDCHIIYDYLNQRIYVYNSTKNIRYAYVYSTKSREWGMVLTDIKSNVNSYPDALVMDSASQLVNLSSPGKTLTTSLLMTRPFKVGENDIFKTIDTIIQRGHFDTAKMKQILYGSNDLFHWFLIWGCNGHFMRGFHGTPYKAYRLVVITTLTDEHSLYGFSLSYEQKLTNRLR